jgi:hypothetical protein
MQYSLTTYAGNKSAYPLPIRNYDTIIDCFGGSLGGTLKAATMNPEASYLVAESCPFQRALIQLLNNQYPPIQCSNYTGVLFALKRIIDEFQTKSDYKTASSWLTDQYHPNQELLDLAALSVARRFFFSSILRTTPGSGKMNVWISPRKILGDPAWKKACLQEFPNIDYSSLNTQERKQFNQELNNRLFSSGLLSFYMKKSAKSWLRGVTPILNEWFSSRKKPLLLFDTHKQLIHHSSYFPSTNALLYCDPPYYNPDSGSFTDSRGITRKHNQTPSYPGHDPRSIDTWDLFQDCFLYGVNNRHDLVLCNYGSDLYRVALNAIKPIYGCVQLQVKNPCSCTGQKSKYTSLPIGEETVWFCTPSKSKK